MRLLAILTVCGLFASSAAFAATLVNGSLNGTIGSANVPSGWTILSPSPDTNNQSFSGAGGSYFVAANNSSDGGTWVGFGRAGSTNEIFGQTISDFIVGQRYRLTWEAGNFGIANNFSFNNANSIMASLDGSSLRSGASLGVSSNWFNQSLEFIATSTTHTLSFGLTSSVTSYMQIDGIGLTAVSSVPEVPLPAAGWLLFGGLAGLGAISRRRKT